MRAARRIAFDIEPLLAGDDVHRRRGRIGAKAVREHEGAAAGGGGGALKRERKPELLQ